MLNFTTAPKPEISTADQLKRMLTDIQGICDEVEYMVTIGELNPLAATLFSENVSEIAKNMKTGEVSVIATK